MTLRYTPSGIPFAYGEVQAAGRFRAEGPVGYFDRHTHPHVLRATREEAEADVAARLNRSAAEKAAPAREGAKT